MPGNTIINDAKLKEQMVFEASLILETVDFLEKEINAKLSQIDSITDDNKARQLASQVKKLLTKLNSEQSNMDAYTLKYETLLNEKANLLPSSRQEKQLPPRGVSPNKGRARKGNRL
jgi:uncharacterized protein YjcR